MDRSEVLCRLCNVAVLYFSKVFPDECDKPRNVFSHKDFEEEIAKQDACGASRQTRDKYFAKVDGSSRYQLLASHGSST